MTVRLEWVGYLAGVVVTLAEARTWPDDAYLFEWPGDERTIVHRARTHHRIPVPSPRRAAAA